MLRDVDIKLEKVKKKLCGWQIYQGAIMVQMIRFTICVN